MATFSAPSGQTVSRRTILRGAASAAALMAVPAVAAPLVPALNTGTAEPFPLSAVRLKPSPFKAAVDANRAYLHSLEADRLLHNFRSGAGLQPKGAAYGGWEGDTIAGHTLGHYLSALSLMHAQTGDAECKRRVDYIVAELADCQKAQGDGYVAGFTRKRGDIVEDGKVVFDELRRGEIRSAGFDLNGCWVPLYNWHKLYTGLFDAQTLCGNTQALDVGVKLGGYIDEVFSHLNDEQVQKVLDCEHGGINESFAELYARTGDRRWLLLAERLYHAKVLVPLSEGRDELANIHANTQIPKLIGLARLAELTGSERHAKASAFFWQTVTTNHSYVIGGNADREYFQAPRSISRHITEQTCEGCNSYNMLKLTRLLYARQADAHYFDFYERAHLNHVLAQQNPATGMFTYMTPLLSGSAREFSTPTEDFWCCVGTGMESHAKHGESVYWRRGAEDLAVNLYIPSTLTWAERGAVVDLDTRYPEAETVLLTLKALKRPATFAVSFRIPAWCTGATLAVNGKPQDLQLQSGYAVVRREWKAGDAVALRLPMALRLESTNDDTDTVAFLHGPLVLAADLGAAPKSEAPTGSPQPTPVSDAFQGPAPALVSASVLDGFQRATPDALVWRTTGIGRPGDMEFKPFYQQYTRRTAVYFKRYTEAQWKTAEAALAQEAARQRDIQARSVDVMHLGEMQPERDHGLEAKISYPVTYRGRNGRDARTGGFFEFKAKVRGGAMVLQATYWGDERKRLFHILVDGIRIATQKLDAERPGEFFDVEYPIPANLTAGKSTVVVRFEPETGYSAGPVFGCRVVAASASQGAPI
ncbi:glycoside hydrolase family 127 protein [Nitrospirillum sp. BR 11163]|uniref:glycoside hydrolase family 127 protein n=1 Tax=Nitrospirillum sp. BR 11163 TaxID=3104323 RepID=UPI002AFF8A2A|nr:glycoside hydrolase family 127 protein [Nitrospirillum sp. BR 11163]MEA1677186.1 glycoside hydrolase family 127 protein [Nitrospirillum sp. BR 11163]